MEGSGLEAFLPLIILQIPFGIITLMMAKRKGRASIWWKVCGFIPLIGYYPVIYLIGITDQAVYDKLDVIEQAVTNRQ